MSEHSDSQNDEPAETTEEKRAFRNVHSQLMRLAASKGKSTMVTGKIKSSYGGYALSGQDKSYCDAMGISYDENANVLSTYVKDTQGVNRKIAIDVLGEQASHDMAILAKVSVEIGNNEVGPIVDDYWFYPGERIEHIRRSRETIGTDDSGKPNRWDWQTKVLETPDATQLNDLLTILETMSES